MLEIGFLIATIICAIGWIKYYIGALTLIYYMTSKDYILPSKNEMKACSTYVVKRLLFKG